MRHGSRGTRFLNIFLAHAEIFPKTDIQVKKKEEMRTNQITISQHTRLEPDIMNNTEKYICS